MESNIQTSFTEISQTLSCTKVKIQFVNRIFWFLIFKDKLSPPLKGNVLESSCVFARSISIPFSLTACCLIDVPCSVYFYTILTDCLLFDRCSLHGWSNMDCWIQRTVVYLSPVETGTSRQCESLLDVTCVYRVGPLKYVFLFEVTCRSRLECLWVECL